MAKRTKQIEDEIVERLSNGEPLRSICRDKRMPAWQAVYQWMDKDEEFSSRIARARDVGHDAISEEAFEIGDEKPERGPDGKVDPGYVAWQKNRIWMRMQLLAKWSPKKYGDKQEITHAGKISLLESIVAADYES